MPDVSIQLTNRQLEELMDTAHRYLMASNAPMGNRVSIGQAYVDAILEITNKNKMVIKDGRLIKKEHS